MDPKLKSDINELYKDLKEANVPPEEINNAIEKYVNKYNKNALGDNKNTISTISPSIEPKGASDQDVTFLVRNKFKDANAKVNLKESPIGSNIEGPDNRSFIQAFSPAYALSKPKLRNAMSYIDLNAGKPPFPFDYQTATKGPGFEIIDGKRYNSTEQEKEPTVKKEAVATYSIPGVGQELQGVKDAYQEQNSPLNRMRELIRKKFPQAELYEVPVGKTTNSLGGGISIENPEKKVFVRLTPGGEIGPLYPDIGKTAPKDFFNRVVEDNEAQILRGSGNVAGELIGGKGGKTLLKLGAGVPGLLRRTTGNVVLPSFGAAGGGQIVDQFNTSNEAGLLNNTSIDPNAVYLSGQENSQKHLAPDALTAGLFRGGASVLNKLTGRGPVTQESQALIDDIRKMVEYNKANGIDDSIQLGRHQHPDAGPIQKRLSNQAQATQKGTYDNLKRSQGEYVDKVVDDIAKNKIDNKDKIVNDLRDYYANQNRPTVTKDKGGEAGKQGVETSLQTEQKKIIDPAYEKADSLFNSKVDKIDLSNAKNTSEEISKQYTAIGKDGNVVNTGPVLPSGMQSIVNTIKSLDNTQVDYLSIKQLRTDLGKEIDKSSDPNIRRLGKKLYNDLTESYLGNSKTPFSIAIKEANKLAKNKFEIQDLLSNNFSSVLNKDLGYKSYSAFSNKDALASKETGKILEFVKKHSPENHEKLIQSIRSNEILLSNDPVKSYREFEKSGALKNITKDTRDLMDLKESAQKAYQYKVSDTAKILESANTSQTKFSNIMKIDNVFNAKKEFEMLHKAIKDTSLKNGHDPKKILNTVVAEDLFTSNVVKQELVGGKIKFSYDRDELNKLIVRYKNTGVWDKLDDGSKLRLQGLNSFLKLLNNSKDIGTTLETAQMITNLKDPFDYKSFSRGVRTLGANKMLAWWFTSGNLGKRLFNQEVKPYTLRSAQNVNFILDSLLEGNERGKMTIEGVKVPVGKVKLPDFPKENKN